MGWVQSVVIVCWCVVGCVVVRCVGRWGSPVVGRTVSGVDCEVQGE